MMPPVTRLLLLLPGFGLLACCVQAQTAGEPPFRIRDKYYALLIGVNAYADPSIPPLDYPLLDANNLREVLVQEYQFEPSGVALLANPTRSQVYEAFGELEKKLGPHDNLLIFYAGHGDWHMNKRIGYWWPSDVSANSNAQKISTVELQVLLEQIACRHLLLVVDACFGGAVLKSRGPATPTGALAEMYAQTSRKAITSGNLTPVPDQGTFATTLVKALRDNVYRHLPGQVLFGQVWNRMVSSSTQQRPSYGPIEGVAEEGGEFIFVRRQAEIELPGTEPVRPSPVTAVPAGLTRRVEVPGQGITPVSLPVRKGDRITVRARGRVLVGQYVGYTLPAGKPNLIMLGLSVPIDPRYNLVAQWPHGALMYRLAGDPAKQWRLCGDNCTWTAPASGTLEIAFQLNDAQQADNYGAYTLDITVTR
ncbi:MAG TPA: caspase family protein [Cytophagales bacterium]